VHVKENFTSIAQEWRVWGWGPKRRGRVLRRCVGCPLGQKSQSAASRGPAETNKAEVLVIVDGAPSG
jgi:hypothetical protein